MIKQKNSIPPASESVEQINLFRWAGYMIQKYPELQLLYHIPNGGYRAQSTAKRLKAEGVKAGVPDICLPVARGNYHGLYIEMKTIKGKTTTLQDAWLDSLRNEGYCTAVCKGWEAAQRTLTDYLTAKI